jgi:hypothetical protein
MHTVEQEEEEEEEEERELEKKEARNVQRVGIRRFVEVLSCLVSVATATLRLRLQLQLRLCDSATLRPALCTSHHI